MLVATALKHVANNQEANGRGPLITKHNRRRTATGAFFMVGIEILQWVDKVKHVATKGQG